MIIMDYFFLTNFLIRGWGDRILSGIAKLVQAKGTNNYQALQN